MQPLPLQSRASLRPAHVIKDGKQGYGSPVPDDRSSFCCSCTGATNTGDFRFAGEKSWVELLHPLKLTGSFGQGSETRVLPSAQQQGVSCRREAMSQHFLLTRSEPPIPGAVAEGIAAPPERWREQHRQFTVPLHGCYRKARKWPHKGILGGSWEYPDKHNSPLI